MKLYSTECQRNIKIPANTVFNTPLVQARTSVKENK